ncbi:hypothetical protein Tco_1239910 [Tanacetum coccineum]
MSREPGAVEGDEGSDVGSVTGVGEMVVDSVGAGGDVGGGRTVEDDEYLMVTLRSRVPSARVEAVAVCQNCLTRESWIVGLFFFKNPLSYAYVVQEAIKSRFGGNDESKKMQKYILKQQFKCFSVSNSQRLHKGYDRFQSLLSQLEIHGAGVSTEDANQKFLRSLPSARS